MCLLLAIPTSIVHRLIMKEPFPHINFDSDISGAIDSAFSRTEATPKPAVSNVPAKRQAKSTVTSSEKIQTQNQNQTTTQPEPKDASDLNKTSSSLAVAAGWVDGAIAAYEVFKVARGMARVGQGEVHASNFTKFTRFASPAMKITVSFPRLLSPLLSFFSNILRTVCVYPFFKELYFVLHFDHENIFDT